ncbi:autotransporter outer membrane beta-barrel domain-containing protein [Bradyrhizobium genosp. L]|uniref:autotransporter outer membrane beta-barrel domain-containing protein n=1 Tax=Bradyrhizobium genosp. L TaxID=83637 RepID=UPI001FEEBEDE|nr:autotransporter domain-containing protein [Bradyrhizobium genosp. L]
MSSLTVGQAQYIWGGAGRSTITTDYNLATNWSNPPAAAPPVAAGQTAIFADTGSATVTLASGIGGPDSWTFTANAQSYNISGLNVNFNLAGPTGGLVDNANAGQTITISSNINESVAGVMVQQLGNSTLVLSGTNTYTGGTVIEAGTLQLGDASHTGSIVGNVANYAKFNIVNADTSGITSIVNDRALPGATPGSTAFSNATSAGTMTITNLNGGATVFNDTSTAANATIVNDNGGLLTFNNQATAGTANISNRDGSLIAFANNSTAGSATITTDSGAGITFHDSSTGGNARFITQGTGYVDFGQSIGPNLDHRIAAGSIEGSGSYYIGGHNTLVVGGNNLSTEVSGVIADNSPCGCTSGSGALEKTGTGTLALSGTNTYTGGTTITAGTLQVDGSIASSSLTTVAANGVLTGAGTVGSAQINAGGTFAPGMIAAPGTSMTVAGNLAFQSGALYLVFLDPATSSFANVTGTATLNGLVGASFTTGTYVAKRYTILTATGGVNGTFAGIGSLGLPSGFKESLSYDTTHAYLDLALAFTPQSGTLSTNQQNVGNAIAAFFNANGGIPMVFGGLTPAGLSQLSGESATGSQQATFDAMSQFISLLIDPSISGRGEPINGGAAPYADATSAYAAGKKTDAFAMFTKAPPVTPFAQRWSVWAAGFGGSQRTDGNAVLGSNNTSSSIVGTAVGADYLISPNTLAGFALAGGGTNFSTNTLGDGRSDLFQAGAFVRHNVGPAYFTAALAYGWQDITTDRIVTVAGIDHLRAQFNANAWSGRIEGGYRFVAPIIGGIGITPYAAGQFVSFELPNYMEQAIVGLNTFALGYSAKTATDTRSELGARTDKSFAMQNGVLTLRGRLAWAHDYDPDRSVLATFQTLPGASFVVNGATHAADSALTSASAEWKWTNGWSAAATFDGEFSNVSNSYAGKGVVRYTW